MHGHDDVGPAIARKRPPPYALNILLFATVPVAHGAEEGSNPVFAGKEQRSARSIRRFGGA